MRGVDREAIGAMLCVGFRGARAGEAALERDLAALAEARVGGVVLFDVDLATGGDRNVESPGQVRELVAMLRARLGAGLVVAVDQEGGRVARLRSARGFWDDPGAREFAKLDGAGRRAAADRQAAQLAGLGITLNFAPCVDVAVDPAGPAIAALGRSYGGDARVVAACAREVMRAHRAHGVACCLKHFPGHGSAGVDSHEDVPDVSGTYDEARELGVFGALAGEADAVMVGHLRCDRFDVDLPASLSGEAIGGVLRGRLGFAGVVVTDSLDMGAIARRWPLEEACVLAINAGADLLVHGFNSPGSDEDAAHPVLAMVAGIERAVAAGRIDGGMGRFEASAGRVLGLMG